MMIAGIDRELAVMRTCAEALGSLAQSSQARVLNWLGESFARSDGPPEQQLTTRSLIQEHLQSQAFQSLRSVQEKYLSVLRCLLKREPVRFLEVACEQAGRKRRYFAEQPEELEEHGSGVKPVRIAPRLYADCNNSTESKQRILRKLMDDLGYDESDVAAAVAALDN